MEKLTNNLKIADNVHFLGRVNNPYKFLAVSYLSILASESESFGNVIVESIICKCPVIAADCKYGPREILNVEVQMENLEWLNNAYELGKYGILYAVGDLNALRDALTKMLEDSKLRNQYIQNGYKRIQEYDIEKIGQTYLDLLN